jgi:hypothetical protein
VGEVGAVSRDPSRESAGVSFFHFNLYSMGRGFSKSLALKMLLSCADCLIPADRPALAQLCREAPGS